MKIILSIFLTFSLISICYADRVCLEKSTGKLIEYQSGDAALGTLKQNAINAGYNADDVEEKYITREEWKIIEEEQIKKPSREEKIKKEQAKNTKREAIKVKLNLSDEDWKNLKEALDD